MFRRPRAPFSISFGHDSSFRSKRSAGLYLHWTKKPILGAEPRRSVCICRRRQEMRQQISTMCVDILIRPASKKGPGSINRGQGSFGEDTHQRLTAVPNNPVRTASQANGFVCLWLKYAEEVFVFCLVGSSKQVQSTMYCS
jgi:hypothetical protein